MKPLKFLLTVFIATALYSSCNKDTAGPQKPECRIVSISPSIGIVTTVVYDAKGRMQTIMQGNYITDFIYTGNTIVATKSGNGNFNRKTIYTLHSNGLPANRRVELNAAGDNWYNSAYQYNGSQVINATTTNSGGGSPNIISYTWTNGNLTSKTDDGETITYAYYTDKPYSPGDYWDIFNFLSEGGVALARNKNRLKSITVSTLSETYEYTTGAEGQLTSVKATGNAGFTIYNLQYQCN